MAPLTWRNVGGTNFGDSVLALRLSGDLLNRGFDMANRSLTQFDEWRTEQNDRAALGAASAVQDPAAYRAMLESGTAIGGVDRSSLSSRALGLLDSRAGALIERDAANYANTRTQTTNAALDRASPAVAALAAAARSGDPAAIQAAQNRLSLEGVPVDQVLRITREIGQIEGTAVSTQGGRISNEGGVIRNRDAEFGYNTRVRDDMDRQSGARIAQEIADRAQTDADATRYLAEYSGNPGVSLSPGTRAVVEAELRARGFNVNPNQGTAGRVGGSPGTTAGAASGRGAAAVAGAVAPSGYDSTGAVVSRGDVDPGAPSAPGAHGTRQGNPYDVTFNFRATDRPLTTMTLDQVLEVQNESIRTQGHSPMGAYQINRDTLLQFAPRVLGENWRSQVFDANAQDRIGRAIYEARRGGDITQTWAALRGDPAAARPGAFANVPWEQFRERVSRAEVGTGVGQSTAQVVQQADETVRRMAERQGQNREGSPLARQYIELATNNDDLATVTDRLHGNNGPLSYLSRGDAMREVENLMRGSRMRPAQAEALIRSSVESQSGFNANPFNGEPVSLNPFGSRVVRYNSDRARALRDSLLSGTTRTDAAVDQTLAQNAAQIQTTSAQVQELQQQLRRAEAALRNGQPVQDSVDRITQQLVQARRNLQLLLAASSGPGSTPEDPEARRRPVAQTTGAR